LSAAAVLLLVGSVATAQVSLDVTNAEIAAGGSGTIDIVLDTGGEEVAGTENELAWDNTALDVFECEVNEAIDKSLQDTYRPSGCEGTAFACNEFKGIVINFGDLSPIADGSVLYTCKVSVSASAAPGEYEVACNLPGSSDPSGGSWDTTCSSSTITVPDVPTVSINLSMVSLSSGGTTSGLPGGTSPGATGVLEVSLELLADVEVAGTENELLWDAGDLSVSNCVVNEAIDKSLQSTFRPSGCAEGSDCNEFKGIVINFGDLSPIAGGSVLYTCDVGLAGGTAAAVLSGQMGLSILCANPGSSNPLGESLTTVCNDAEVVIVPDTPTPTPTNTATQTPTLTVIPTDTPGTPTNTPTNTRDQSGRIDDDSCQIVAPASSSLGWILLMPAAVLFRLRRRNR
jgi:hypothetical protein